MQDIQVPKWQREIKSFLGVKSCLILENNIYDEYPSFEYSGSDVKFKEIANLDRLLFDMVKQDGGTTVFWDPNCGFYIPGGLNEEKQELFSELFRDYQGEARKRGNTIYFCPTRKVKSDEITAEEREWINKVWPENSDKTIKPNQRIFMSEIIRRAVSFKEERKQYIVFVLKFASRLQACNSDESESNEMFLNLLTATESYGTVGTFKNMIIMVVDKYNDIPVWFYLNNPNVRSISLGVPDRNTRRLYLNTVYGSLEKYSVLGLENCDFGVEFVAETEGLQCRELEQILKLAYKMHIEPQDIHKAFQLYKFGVLDNPWDMLEENFLRRMSDILQKRVKGQKAACDKVENVLMRAVGGLSGLQHSSASHKPRGILFFAGPTGVGKTETAKAIAQSIFGDENACIRFDMSEYRLEQSDQKLFGAPPGYIGYEGGGQLTNEVKRRPFSVLLFDEIEKASPTILDKFLQILEDGRMTDNQGNTVYFGETIIIFTSNIGLTELDYDEHGRVKYDSSGSPVRVPAIRITDPTRSDTLEFQKMVSAKVKDGVKKYFVNNGRPELLNRLGEDNIVVFQFIDKSAAEAICESKIEVICREIKRQKDITLIIDNKAKENLKIKAVLERADGGRGVGNMLERELLNPLASCLCEIKVKLRNLYCTVNDDGMLIFEVMEDGDANSSSC